MLTLLFSFQNCGGRLTASDQSIQTTDFLSTSNSEIDLSRFSADFSSLSGEETLIYLIAGQSNATGFGSVNSLPADLKAVPSGVDYYFQDKKINYFSNLRDDNGDQSEDFGVEVGLATNLKKMFPNNKVVIIKVGVSGAPIKKWLSQYYENNQLLSGKSECYLGNSSLKCVDSLSNDIPPLKTVFNKIISNYKNPKLASFIWLQGESDALYWRETGNSYGKNLNLLFNQIKTELRFNQIIISRIFSFMPSQFPGFDLQHADQFIPLDGINYIREVQSNAIKDNGSFVKILSTDKLSRQDYYHFDSKSLLRLGQCFALVSISTASYFECTSTDLNLKNQLSDYKVVDPGLENKNTTPAPAPTPVTEIIPNPNANPNPAAVELAELKKYVTTIYKKYLDRDPDQEGLNYWSQSLQTGSLLKLQIEDLFANLCSSRGGYFIPGLNACQFGSSCITSTEGQNILSGSGTSGFKNCRLDSIDICRQAYGDNRKYLVRCDVYNQKSFLEAQSIKELYIKYFNRTADVEGYQYWSSSGQCLKQIEWVFKTHPGCQNNCNPSALKPNCS